MSNTTEETTTTYQWPRHIRRVLERKRKKIAKRGPMISDFTVQWEPSMEGRDPIPYITFKEMKILLPSALYNAIEDLVKNSGGPAIVNENGFIPGLYVGDCAMIFENAKHWARQQVIHGRT